MKGELDIMMAHVFIEKLVHGGALRNTPKGVPRKRFAEIAASVHGYHQVLAWLVGDPCGATFQENLELLKEIMAQCEGHQPK